MKNDKESEALVASFLRGEMGPEVVEEFKIRCDTDTQLRLLLEKESGVDSMFLNVGEEKNTDIHFSSVVDNVLYPDSKEHRVTTSALWLRVYAIAATIVLLLSGGFILQRSINSVLPEKASLSVAGLKGGTPIPQSGKSITRLSDDALLVAEEGTKAQVLNNEDESISIIIAQGNICLDIKENLQQLSYNVVTPHMAVALHGTIVRMVVTELETEINVLEGAVEVTHRYNSKDTKMLESGYIGFADYNSLQANSQLTPEVCTSRKNMLRAYILWIQDQKHG